MLVVVSPAKRLDESPAIAMGGSAPVFQDAADELAAKAARLTGPKLEKLMHISASLGKLNRERFRDFSGGEGLKPAAEMFSGDTYLGLEAGTLESDEIAYAQDHLRILSGLYGLLRPQDLIMPHRLEMGSRLQHKRNRNLYEFWGDRIAEALNDQAEVLGTQALINCASVEYFKAANREALKLRIITPVFMEAQESGPKIVAFFAKKARGAMARFVIQNRLTDPEGLKGFDSGGYTFDRDLSEGDRWVFLREG